MESCQGPRIDVPYPERSLVTDLAFLMNKIRTKGKARSNRWHKSLSFRSESLANEHCRPAGFKALLPVTRAVAFSDQHP